MVDDFCSLAWIEFFPKELEDPFTHCQRIHRELRGQLLQNMISELLYATIPGRLSGHVPALVVKAAHKHRKLRAKMYGHLRSQPIA